MRYLIVEPKVKSKAPNIALMKWARWCEENGHEYTYVKGCIKPENLIKDIPDVILISMIFTYYSKRYKRTIDFYRRNYPNSITRVGGVFPTLFPDWFKQWEGIQVHHGMCPEIEYISPKYNVDILYENEDCIHEALDTITLYASRGCVNKCKYCAVPTLEGGMRSFKSIKQMLQDGLNDLPNARSVVLYDNNFTEHFYFDQIVDELIEFGLPVDIHGLHVDSFTEHHAEKLSKLKWESQSVKGSPYIRFSFDKKRYAENIHRALTLVRDHEIQAEFFAYMLFNFNDRPEDFWWRIQKTQEMVDEIGIDVLLFPQRYEPFTSLERNKYIGRFWTDELVRGLIKLYTNSLRGFIRINRHKTIYEHLGNSFPEFIEKIKKANKNPKMLTDEELHTFF